MASKIARLNYVVRVVYKDYFKYKNQINIILYKN